jgi:hypothetical protein
MIFQKPLRLRFLPQSYVSSRLYISVSEHHSLMAIIRGLLCIWNHRIVDGNNGRFVHSLKMGHYDSYVYR